MPACSEYARALVVGTLLLLSLPAMSETDAPTTQALVRIIAGDHRSAANVARDPVRHPLETLAFFGIRRDMKIVEMWPGSPRYYAEILAPLLRDEGVYYAANFHADEKSFDATRSIEYFANQNAQRPELYDRMVVTAFSDSHQEIAPRESVDMVLTFRNVHNFAINGYVDDFFAAMFRALKPGGILGLVEHRGDPQQEQDPRALSGYVRQDYCIALAQTAGFELVASSEINSNPADTKNYPEGVWTLPPTSRLSDSPDAGKYLAIGESDRMTLKFRKPINPASAGPDPSSSRQVP